MKKVFLDIENSFNEKNYINDPPRQIMDLEFENLDDDFDPYESGPWAGINWFCIRCGFQLKQFENNEHWKIMKKDGTQMYHCSNKKCCHYGAPLILHHPLGGYQSPAGESYSISWVR